ncbi:uncharacterized protein BJ212DRAFT_1304105 [Suillus subaureus]|uniref:Uncharacterized protein n=1 Tax=Suillus subaureus TaxID=48587 RepID=A0A9P7DXJ7_9AGAM|nr:uncharacterized protein BJ212DRAFT_1304105 [Suillus subaureus]KAG1805320.1 hypothetical protein BJ212DRAFT_1304105 [Suillus subaureus]
MLWASWKVQEPTRVTVLNLVGCHEYFTRRGSYLQHLHKSSDSCCQHECKRLDDSVHCQPIRRDTPHALHNSAPTQATPDITPDPQPFGGDYFGDDYGEEDFPFVNDEEPIHVDVHHDGGVAEEDENAPESNDEDIEHTGLDQDKHEQLCNAPVTIKHFRGEAGAPLHNMPQVKRSEYTNYSANVEGSADNLWAPFNSQIDWEVAHWAKVHEALALYGDPEHAQYLSFTPERHYVDADKTQCERWWATQEVVEQSKPGATIIPIIISSDKIQIMLFQNKTAYPVYLTIGNLPKCIQHKPSCQGQILLAYLPTTCLMQIANKASHHHTLVNLFHACMSRIIQPLKLAAFIRDYPEQCLVTGTMNRDCPVCTCPHNELGKHPSQHKLRDLDAILDALELLRSPQYTQACHSVQIKPLQHPFWKDLLYLNIFQSITPDILHQLYQGVMKHMISWITEIVGTAEVDA